MIFFIHREKRSRKCQALFLKFQSQFSSGIKHLKKIIFKIVDQMRVTDCHRTFFSKSKSSRGFLPRPPTTFFGSLFSSHSFSTRPLDASPAPAQSVATQHCKVVSCRLGWQSVFTSPELFDCRMVII